MLSLLEVVAPVFCVIAFGYITTWKGWFPHAGSDALMFFAQRIAIPFLLFRAVATLDLPTAFNPPLLISYYTAATACFALGIAAGRYVFGRSWEDSVSIGFCCLFANSVLLGLPITERAYGAEALVPNFAIIAMHAPYIYLIGIVTMECVKSNGGGLRPVATQVSKAMFHNTLVLGIVLGFVVNLSGVALPQIAWDAVDLFARAALPTALFALGGVLVQYKPEGEMRIILFVCAVTLCVRPALMWFTGSGFELSRGEFNSAILTAAMAPGINAYIFANMYGAAKRVAASSVLFATVISVVTVPIWLALLG